MNPLIADQFVRRWWLWLVCFFANLGFGAILLPLSSQLAMLPIAIFLGPGIWLMDLYRGYPRVVLSLPFTAKESGRTLWMYSVALPTLVMAVASLIGVLLKNYPVLPVGNWLIYISTNALVYGSMFCIQCDYASPNNAWRVVVRFFRFGILIGCILIFFQETISPMMTPAFYVVSIALTVSGWRGAERMMLLLGERRAASQSTSNAPRKFVPPGGFGGTSFSLANSIGRTWLMGLLMLGALHAFTLFQGKPFDWHHLTRPMANSGFLFPFIFVFAMQTAPLFLNLRHLRTLPLSPGRLVVWLFCEGILPLFSFALALTLLAWHETGATECLSFIKIEFMIAATTSLFLTASIWNFSTTFSKGILATVFLLSTLTPMFYELGWGLTGNGGLPVWFVAIYTLGLLILSHQVASRVIARSSSPYRARPSTMIFNHWYQGR